MHEKNKTEKIHIKGKLHIKRVKLYIKDKKHIFTIGSKYKIEDRDILIMQDI